MAGSCGCGDCKDCKRVREHVASLLPFRVIEAVVGKPLRIAGVAMVAGLSRNFAVYTPQQIEALAPQMIGAPVYIEHVAADKATGKVTKCNYDAVSRSLLYEAEIYDAMVAEKIRQGLIQHVSVGADYASIDEFNAHAFHGLSNPSLSLVAVPGIPETNIKVLEHLAAASQSGSKVKLPARELLQDLQCVFCGGPGEYLVSVCTSCGDNAQSLVLPALEHLPVRELHLAVREAVDDLPTLFSAFKVRFVASPDACEVCKALDGKEFIYGQEPGLPHDGCKCPGYRLVERLIVHVHSVGVESLDEKDVAKLAEQLAAKLKAKEALMLKCPKCGMEFDAAQWEANNWKCPNKDCGVEVVAPVLSLKGDASAAEKLSVAESARDASKTELANVNKLLEKYRKVAPGVELLADPPVLMPVSEHISVLERLVPPVMVEHSSMGMQRQGQAVKAELLKAKEKLKAK